MDRLTLDFSPEKGKETGITAAVYQPGFSLSLSPIP
jgi:hypothetical protein